MCHDGYIVIIPQSIISKYTAWWLVTYVSVNEFQILNSTEMEIAEFLCSLWWVRKDLEGLDRDIFQIIS
jgi:hypothetical protein